MLSDKPSSPQPTVCETLGEILPCGAQLELVRKSPHALPEILRWDGLTATTAAQLECSGQIYRPAAIHPTVLQRLHLPSHVAPYGSTKELFNKINNCFLAHFNLAESSAALLSAFAVSTLFVELLPVAPSISIAISTTTEGVLLLRLLSCFCYHPLRLGTLSANGILNLPTQLRPTLLINGSGLSKGAHTLLNASNHRGLSVQKSESLVDIYCAKAIVGEQHATFLENAIQVTIDSPRRVQTSSFDEHAEAELAKEFQPQLLRYAWKIENEYFRPALMSRNSFPQLGKSPGQKTARVPIRFQGEEALLPW